MRVLLATGLAREVHACHDPPDINRRIRNPAYPDPSNYLNPASGST